MDEVFHAGVLSAWAVAQLAVGAFFALAERVGRRQTEYLLFGVLCFLLAVVTASIACLVGTGGTTDLAITQAGLAAAILAIPVNLHFVLLYTAFPYRPFHLWLAYGSALALEGLNLTVWWGTDTWAPIYVGLLRADGMRHMASAPISYAFSIWAVVQFSIAVYLVFKRFRSGRREALSALVGSLILLGAVAHDALLFSALGGAAYLTPHAFLTYGFGIATTLLFRYRAASLKVESTVQELEKSSRELRKSHAELKQVQDELIRKQQLAAVGELAAVIAHEVRNPLAIIVNAAAALRRPKVADEDRRTLLGIVEEETARLNRLVTDLLRYSRPIDLKKRQVSLAELTRPALALERYGETIQVEVVSDPAIKTVWVDQSLFRVVLDNLIDNACQSMPEGGKVKVSVSHRDAGGSRSVQIQIQDFGQGMERQTLSRAKDPFFTTRPSGTGLGLPIVQRIVEAHGGELSIHSVPRVGTTVTVLVPVAPEPSTHEQLEASH